jgi:hypothetical protein
MKKSLLFLFSLFITGVSFSQNVAINSTGALPAASAMLDITSTTSGLLIPRMTSAQKTAIAAPATGLIVYDVTLNAFWYYNGTAWVPLLSSATGWMLTGNSLAGTEFMGSTNAQPVRFFSNNIERARILSNGEVLVGSTTLIAPTFPSDILCAYKTAGGAANNWASNGVNTTTGGGSGYFQSTSTTNSYNGVEAITSYAGTASAPAGIFGLAISNALTQTGVGVRGSTNGRDGVGVRGSRISTGGALGWGGLFQNDLGYTGFFGVASDQRIKKNIRPFDNGLELIMKLKPVNYEHNFEVYPYLGLGEGKQYGFIAQELESVIPELVAEKYLDKNACSEKSARTPNDSQLEKFKLVSYVGLIPVLVEAIQEQQKQIEDLKKQLDAKK